MNFRLLCKMLGLIAALVGGTMAFSLPWALPILGGDWTDESRGFFGLLGAMLICFLVGALLSCLGRGPQGQLFRKEAMAVVGLTWVLATLLGALPYLFSGTQRGPGMPMSPVDAMFESQSGFSTTGATVLTELEDPSLVPRCILFWRSSTHFLGGLGIIVLFVAILGQGSAGKALMQAEMPGPSQSSQQARMQHTAWVLFFIYAGLNAFLTLLLWVQGLSVFDSLCHAFGTMATGGFSTYNASVGHFQYVPGLNGPRIEMTIVVFMVLAGTNFMLLYFVALGKLGRLWPDVEWRTYMLILAVVTLLVVGFGIHAGDFADSTGMKQATEAGPVTADSQADPIVKQSARAVRYGLFQVVSIMTTTGFCTDDFDRWNSFARGVMLLLMFIGACAGSTGGGMKVIRHILFVKILHLELEQAFHPSVVRPLRLAGEPVPEQDLRRQILVYYGLIMAICTVSWLLTITFEPDSTWAEPGQHAEHKLVDAASCVAATLNNIGPGLGVVGATKNYTNFQWYTKLLFIWLMMLGRLEIYVILVLFSPRFWRSQ
ncbi:MAG: TrkH family potassium uptake protein [Thermoguttaceae bacterium]|jgi:trk system potassium uptake protein TrkH|nr:TrkH family potassium uptake protein [Thermoguttaceae bacterium]